MQWSWWRRRDRSVPDEVYVGFIRSLYDGPRVVLSGTICNLAVAMLVTIDSGMPWFMLGAAAIFVSGFLRYRRLASVDPADIVTLKDAERHQRILLAEGAITSALIGLFTAATILWSNSQFCIMAVIALAMGSTVTIAGRNYGSSLQVRVLMGCLLGIPALGCLLSGKPVDIAFGLLSLPFMLIVAQIASSVRGHVFAAISEGTRAKELAARFDKALNTMPQGLLMVNGHGRIVVANAEAANLLGLRDVSQLPGRTVDSIIGRIVAAGLMSKGQKEIVLRMIFQALADGQAGKVPVALTDGRHFEISAREGDNSLGVILFGNVSDRVAAERKILNLARYDTLTGFPNRYFFNEVVSSKLANSADSSMCALAMLNVDDLKSLNDLLGHQLGDQMIKEIADRLRTMESPNMFVGRLLGDEFVIYLDGFANEEQLKTSIHALISTLQAPMTVADHRLTLKISCGVVATPTGWLSLNDMIVKADLALAHVKKDGPGGWKFYEDHMEEAFRSKQRLKEELRAVVAARQLRMVYQPIVAVDSMRIEACEALCRWYHPQMGYISPAVFIPLAEEIGIISEITDFALHASCAECVNWPEHVSVSVNLSAIDFRNRDIVDVVNRALRSSGLAAHRLEIEVTESALLGDGSLAVEIVERLRSIGVSVALDDFGTGYSNLSYLRRLPLDKIKIDQSFVADIATDPKALALVTDMANLGKRLGLKVTIEGVETFEQMAVLSAKVKPNLVQGFLFGSALTGPGITVMCATSWPFAAEPEVEAQRKRNKGRSHLELIKN